LPRPRKALFYCDRHLSEDSKTGFALFSEHGVALADTRARMCGWRALELSFSASWCQPERAAGLCRFQNKWCLGSGAEWLDVGCEVVPRHARQLANIEYLGGAKVGKCARNLIRSFLMNSQACNERWERESGRTARTIKEWLREIGRNHNALVFPNPRRATFAVRHSPLARKAA